MNNDSAQFGPSLAIDHLLTYRKDGQFISAQEDFPWLQIKLASRQVVSKVTIFNRIDGLGAKWKNLHIRAGTEEVTSAPQTSMMTVNTLCGALSGYGQTGESQVIKCNSDIEANYITLQLNNGNTSLAVNEVFVNTNGKFIFSLSPSH